jgi:hypothetical protein
VIFTALQGVLGTPLKVVRAGVRDGAVMMIAAERAAEAA